MPMTRVLLLSAFGVAAASAAAAQPLRCDMGQYKPASGLNATVADNLLALVWRGDAGRDLRMRFTITDGRPVIRDLAIRKTPAPWAILGDDLLPEYHVVTGVRRMTTQQADP